jgi:hypothetical protein
MRILIGRLAVALALVLPLGMLAGPIGNEDDGFEWGAPPPTVVATIG